ncbi:MAG: hypothetical protein A2Y95_12745 [Deltaproteobacteria bacterium RBG_13_65_10]|nr:MAG: hypothetical protein A2Y95_12745 [Deltaproteobacteria bacterium RBG_13_65_10]
MKNRGLLMIAIASIAAMALLIGTAPRARAQAALVADAGADLAIECASSTGTQVSLDGTGSSQGPDITYLWSAPGVTFDPDPPTILTPTGTFPLGTTTVTLIVTLTDPVTQAQMTAMDMVDVTIQDTAPPIITTTVKPATLWPPNHKLVKINTGVVAVDACDPNPVVMLDAITSNEPDNDVGDGNTTDDIQGADLGTDDTQFLLRAERQGPCTGRVYTATYSAIDTSGNASVGAVQVAVPHDQGQGKKKGRGNGNQCDPGTTGDTGSTGATKGNGNGHGPKK